MGSFGSVTFVEIDKRKGFAYVDFADHEGLVKAITASPISIAQGSVQVLERKETKKAAPSQPSTDKEKPSTETQTERPKRGGRGRGRRGGAAQSSATTTGDASSSKTPAPTAPDASNSAAAS